MNVKFEVKDIGVDFKNHKNVHKCFSDFWGISLSANVHWGFSVTCLTAVGSNAGCYSPPHGICETANDVIGYFLLFSKGRFLQVIDIIYLTVIVYPTPKLVPHVFYGVLVGRNRRPWQDVDAVLSQKLCRQLQGPDFAKIGGDCSLGCSHTLLH